MSDLDDYQKFLDAEKTAKNLASLIMMIIAIFLFVSYSMVPEQFFGLSAHTLQVILICSGIVLLIGGMYVRFINITEYGSEY